jgi:hypothetical protein
MIALVAIGLTKCSCVLFVRLLFTKENRRAWLVCSAAITCLAGWTIASPMVIGIACGPGNNGYDQRCSEVRGMVLNSNIVLTVDGDTDATMDSCRRHRRHPRALLGLTGCIPFFNLANELEAQADSHQRLLLSCRVRCEPRCGIPTPVLIDTGSALCSLPMRFNTQQCRAEEVQAQKLCRACCSKKRWWPTA